MIQFMKKYWPYLAPLVVFILFTNGGALLPIPNSVYWLYPLKTVAVGVVLVFYRKQYAEIVLRCSWEAIVVGIVVFVIWVAPEGLYPLLGTPKGFNPYLFDNPGVVWTLIAFRLIGAMIVVPIFEELFWRSFALRFIINEDINAVPIGTFTWFSFVIVTLGFGFEHHRWLVGLLAGVLYNGLLYYKKNLTDCIVAHAVTNLLLGLYVLWTQQWTFW